MHPSTWICPSSALSPLPWPTAPACAGFYLARDGYRDDELVRALNASLARCGIEGYTARHCTSSVEHGVAVTDAHGHALPRPARDSHGRALLRLLETLADGSGLAAYGVALLAADEPSARV